MTDSPPEEAPVRTADLTGEVCPMTFVKAKLLLERLQTGQLVEFILTEGEQMRDVPRSLKQEGHRIERVRQEGRLFHLLVRKSG